MRGAGAKREVGEERSNASPAVSRAGEKETSNAKCVKTPRVAGRKRAVGKKSTDERRANAGFAGTNKRTYERGSEERGNEERSVINAFFFALISSA